MVAAVAVICRRHEAGGPLQPTALSMLQAVLVILTQFDHESFRSAMEKHDLPRTFSVNGTEGPLRNFPALLGVGHVEAVRFKAGQPFVSSHVPQVVL